MGRRKPASTGLACRATAATRGEVAWPTIADRVRVAGGVMIVREGHAVAANFGSAASELAVCIKHVGVLEHLVKGETNAEIARTLIVSEGTVKFHVKNILRKMNAANRAEATSLYMRLSLRREG